MADKSTLRDLWNSYRAEVVPRDATPEEVERTRLIFYSGATSTLFLVTGGVFKSRSPDQFFARLKRLIQEVGTLARDGRKGRA